MPCGSTYRQRDLVAFYFLRGLALQLQQNEQQRRENMNIMQRTRETDFLSEFIFSKEMI